MFNVTVLKMKDVIKYLVGIIITIIFVIYATRYFSTKKEKNKNENIKKQTKIASFQFGGLTSCLDKAIPAMSNINEEYNKMEAENDKISSNNLLEGIIKTEISSIKGIEKIEENNKANNFENNEIQEKVEEQETNEIQENITLASDNEIKTEVVTVNPIAERFNTQYGNVKIKNQTTYNLTEEMLNPNITIDNKNVVIFHTHSCESYTPSEMYLYESNRKL